MDLTLSVEHRDELTVRLRDGRDEATVTISPVGAASLSLSRALDDAMSAGYGECFWPGQPGGQYWWIFKRVDATLEVALMWTRGGASLWEHVFRATDAVSWIRERWQSELGRIGTRPEEGSQGS